VTTTDLREVTKKDMKGVHHMLSKFEAYGYLDKRKEEAVAYGGR